MKDYLKDLIIVSLFITGVQFIDISIPNPTLWHYIATFICYWFGMWLFLLVIFIFVEDFIREVKK